MSTFSFNLSVREPFIQFLAFWLTLAASLTLPTLTPTPADSRHVSAAYNPQRQDTSITVRIFQVATLPLRLKAQHHFPSV